MPQKKNNSPALKPAPVRWEFDMRAEWRTGGAVLYDPIGFEFRNEGEQLSLSGQLGSDGIFEMCVPVVIVTDPVLPILP